MNKAYTIRLLILLVVSSIIIFTLKGNLKETSNSVTGNSSRISEGRTDSYADSVQTKRTFPQVSRWIAAGIGDGGFYRCIRYNPVHHDTVYLCGDRSGMDRSTDYGATWTPINNGITNYYVEDLAVDPDNGKIVLAGTAGGILKTTDAGNNWTIKGTNVTGKPNYIVQENVAISAVSINKGNSNYWYAGTSTYAGHPEGNMADTIQVYKSTDKGETWANMFNSYSGAYRYRNLVFHITPDPKNVNVVYVATADALLKTTNGGSSWVALTNHYKVIKDSYYKGNWWVEIDSNNSNRIYSATLYVTMGSG